MNLKKFLAAGLSAVMLLTMTACGSKDAAASGDASSSASASAPAAKMPVPADTVVLTVNDKQYTAKDYASFVNNARSEWSAYLSQYGMTEEDYVEMYGEEVLGGDLRVRAENYMVIYEVLERKMDEYGLELTEDDTAINALYASMGLDENYGNLQAMLLKLDEYCVGEGGILRPSDDELLDYFHDNYLRCKHVLIHTVDDNNEPLENQDELKALADDIAARAAAGEDFDKLIELYNEDAGMTAQPEGYVFTEGKMVAEFYEGTLALAENATSEPIKSPYGWHIIKRLPLRDEDFAPFEETVLGVFINFAAVVEEWAMESVVELKPEAEKIDYLNASSYLK